MGSGRMRFSGFLFNLNAVWRWQHNSAYAFRGVECMCMMLGIENTPEGGRFGNFRLAQPPPPEHVVAFAERPYRGCA